MQPSKNQQTDLDNSKNSSSSTSTQQSTSHQNEQKSKKDNQFQIELSKYKNFTEEIKNKNLNSIEMLSASVANIIHPEDSIIYTSKNNYSLPTKYPVYPLRLMPELLQNFSDDTLFFIFYIQQESKEMVLRELQKRGWMFNMKFYAFFKLDGQPKSETDEYIEGKFKYFDFEHDWIIRAKREFKFERKHLEKTIDKAQ